MPLKFAAGVNVRDIARSQADRAIGHRDRATHCDGGAVDGSDLRIGAFEVIRTGAIGAGDGVKADGSVFIGGDRVGDDIGNGGHIDGDRIGVAEGAVGGGQRQRCAAVVVGSGREAQAIQRTVNSCCSAGDRHRAGAVVGDSGAGKGHGSQGAVSDSHRSAQSAAIDIRHRQCVVVGGAEDAGWCLRWWTVLQERH